MLKVLSTISHSGQRFEVGDHVEEGTFNEQELNQLLGSKSVEVMEVAEPKQPKGKASKKEVAPQVAPEAVDSEKTGDENKGDEEVKKPSPLWSKPKLREFATASGVEFAEEDDRTEIYNKIKAAGKLGTEATE